MMLDAKVYTTSHGINQVIGLGLAKGFDAQKVPSVTLLPGLAIVYGILRGTGDILKQCEIEKHEYLYVDHSFFTKCRSDHEAHKFNGYYRCIKNGRYHNDFSVSRPSDRFAKLKIEIQPWQTNGNHIVVVPLSSAVGNLIGIDPRAWLQNTISRLSQLTKREIIIKPKDSDETLARTLMDAHCLVTLDSNAATDAVIAGIPVFTSRSNAAWPVANLDISGIEVPLYPDRNDWLNKLAYMQFRMPEIINGYAKKVLYE